MKFHFQNLTDLKINLRTRLQKIIEDKKSLFFAIQSEKTDSNEFTCPNLPFLNVLMSLIFLMHHSG